MPKIHRIVLTGGPCGGKTTALAGISERLQSLGYRVFLVPEAATMMITGGCTFEGATAGHVHAIESNLLRLQMAMEEAFLGVAGDIDTPSVLICDRGTIDVSAYLPPEIWQALLDENEWSMVGLRDQRYDAVIHLVTAANGAEAFYTTSNNAARRETPGEARGGFFSGTEHSTG